MTVKELAQKIKDSDYTCRGINCRECISVNGFGCCLQADKKLFVSMFLLSQNKEGVKAPYPSYKHLFGESIEQTALRHSNDLINSLRGDIDYAKTIIRDLLNNSDEYARQRAMDFLKED